MTDSDGAMSGAIGGAAAGAATMNPYAIAIGAGAGLLQGLLSAKARREEEERRRKRELELMGQQTQIQAAKTQQEGERGAFAQFMQGYQSALLK